MRRLISWLFALATAGAVIGGVAAVLVIWHVSRDLPDHAQLKDYEPAVMSRVHAGDGRVLAEFAIERRLFVPVTATPPLVIDAVLAAEDKSFWTHPGVSLPDILRAAVTNVVNWGQRRPVGASTITQQVAKNFLLTNEVSLERKLKEAILATRIEEALPKQRILELYLNEIYLGFQAYGVAAAALNYFGKSLDELNLAEAAYIAALPKAPSNYHPTRHPEAAKARRDWVLGRMLEDGRITLAEHDAARAQPLVVRDRREIDGARADYFTEEVRRELVGRYGEEQVYKGGLSVQTSLDPKLQRAIDEALRKGMLGYDRRHGWRGPLERIDPGAGWRERLNAVAKPGGLAPWQLAMVVRAEGESFEIALGDGARGVVPPEEFRWARATLAEQKVGASPKSAAEIAKPGDVVVVERLAGDANPPRFVLRQIPNIGAAAVALDPHTGRVLAMSGGWSFESSQFNRATQAQRQPGSAFKPFVYLTALEHGFTPSSIVLDAPITVDQGDRGVWKPGNYSRHFYGPTPMRVGVEQSRNLMTIRVASAIGLEHVVATARDFGITDKLPPYMSGALGVAETTPLKLTAAYAMLVNGGKRVTPTLVDRVQDRNGRTVFRADQRPCPDCVAASWAEQRMPDLPDTRARVVDAASAFQMVSILQGAVERGTGRRILGLGKPLAGKTGTTNDSFDTWFIGFSPDLVVGVWFGFDNPRTLGPNETGTEPSTDQPVAAGGVLDGGARLAPQIAVPVPATDSGGIY